MFNPAEVAQALQQELGSRFRCRGAIVWYRQAKRGMPYLRVRGASIEGMVVRDGRDRLSLGLPDQEVRSWDLAEPDSIERAVAWLRGQYDV